MLSPAAGKLLAQIQRFGVIGNCESCRRSRDDRVADSFHRSNHGADGGISSSCKRDVATQSYGFGVSRYAWHREWLHCVLSMRSAAWSTMAFTFYSFCDPA